MKKTAILAGILLFGSALFASTTPQERLASFEKHKAMKETSLLRQVSWRNAGPYFMGGRIVDIESYAHNPHKILIAAATGGLWMTENNGTTWQSLFDNESAFGLGDIAVSETNENLIWAGTGEENSGRSIYSGTGVFKSVDGGKTWAHMGLADSHHIGQIVINPKNNEIVYVAAMGHLFTDNEERGLFKTTDGGKTWEKVLYLSPKTGVIDVVLDPRDPEIIYAAAWQKDRKAWNFVENGPESAIYKSKDGGKTWKKLAGGFPQGEYVGRVGFAVSPSRPDTVYAILDNQEPGPVRRPQREAKSGLTADAVKAMSVKDFLALDSNKLDLFLKENYAPAVFTADKVLAAVKAGEITPNELVVAFSGGAMAMMFSESIKGAEVYQSTDAGETWRKTHTEPMANMVFSSYGYYFGQIRVSPDNENIVYVLGVPALKSVDGGKTFKEIPDMGGNYGTRLDDVHPDHHALWINPGNPKVLWLGNDGGLNVSYDGGATFQKVNNIPLAQCYTVSFDMEKPYNLFVGLQDNGVNMGPSDYLYGNRDREWKIIMGGDGAFVEPAISRIPATPGRPSAESAGTEFSDPDTVYAASQFGAITRLNLKNEALSRSIRPRALSVQPAYRFNWLTPFFVSRHNPYTIYLGGNKVMKSVDRGDNWIEISPDLTDRSHIDGNVPYACITALAESPLAPEVLYAGTDDGNVWATRNGGGAWEKIMAGLPKKWVTRLVASQFQRGRVYLTMIGYREDDFSAYVFASEDYGRSWTPIKANLPDEGINVLREHPSNENLLFLGTDLTVYATFDRGKEWHSLRADLPTLPVYDLKIHPREKDLIIGTHARGVYILKIDKIEQLTPAILAKPLHAFDPAEAFVYPSNIAISGGSVGGFSTSFEFITSVAGPAKIVIKNTENQTIGKTLEVQAIRGLNAVKWDLRRDDGKSMVTPGKYSVEFHAGGATETKTLVVGYPRRG